MYNYLLTDTIKYCAVQDNNIREQILFNQPQYVRPSFVYSFPQFMVTADRL